MKAILVLCLISLITCKIDVLESIKCFVARPKVQELGLKIFSYVYTKNYSEILPAVINAVPDLYKAVQECLIEDAHLKCRNEDGYYLCLKINPPGKGRTEHCLKEFC